MGESHAKAYLDDPRWEIAGLVSRSPASRQGLKAKLGIDCPDFAQYEQALKTTRPDAVCIATYPDTHACFARMAMEQGCHVFLEKPMAETVGESEALVALAEQQQRKLAVGYILRHHPSWIRFVEEARKLGKPLVMRMNLNQQSSGPEWQTHRNLMQSLSPIVDCGVHYVDVMCQMTSARPIRVQAIGARLAQDIPPGQYNYGCLQVMFDDGSVGWYEAGWGPMMSAEATFIKDVIGPKGSISIAAEKSGKDSASIEGHTKTDCLLSHSSALNEDAGFLHQDIRIETSGEPDHDDLCAREQAAFLKAILHNVDLRPHLQDAVNSLRIVLAADLSIHEGRAIELG